MIVDLPDFLIILLLIVLPILGFAFCQWRIVRLATRRTPETSVLTARRITILGYVSIAIVGVPVLIGLIGLTIAGFNGEFKDPGVTIAAAVVLIGVAVLAGAVSGLSFRLAGSIYNLVDDEHQNLQTQIDRSTGYFEISAWCLLGVCVLLISILAIVLLPISIAFLLFGVPSLIWQRKRARESQLLWALALSVKNGRTLSAEIRRHARAWGGFHACRLKELATYLESGRDLGFALQMTPGILPGHCVSDIRAAVESGTLSEELSDIAAGHVASMRERYNGGSPVQFIMQGVSYMTVCVGVLSFLMYWIIPKFKAIFEGFGTELPPLTEVLIAVSDVCVAYGYLFMWVFIPLGFIGWQDWRGWQNLRLPIFSWFYPAFDSAGILRHLAHAIDRGRPLADAVRAVANTHFRPTVQEAMARIYVDVESGNDPWSQFRRRRFLTTRDLAVIETAQQAGNLTWALREVASLREHRLRYRMALLTQLFRPVVILGVACIVGFICIAMFMPLIKLVNDLS